MARLHERAKSALKSMKALRIGFDEVIGEGIDPLILTELYREIEDLAQSKPSSTPRSPQEEDSNQAKQKANATQTRQETNGDTHLHTQISTQTSTTTATAPEQSSGPVATKNVQLSVPPNPQVAAGSNEKATAAMERKDRIAQLLAAKASKITPSKADTGSSSHAQTPTTPATLKQATVENPVENLALPKPSGNPPVRNAVRPPNPAQTELVRKKMAALKREAEAREALQRAQIQSQANNGSNSSSPRPAAHLVPPQNWLARSNSPLDNTPIPGLFMAHGSRTSSGTTGPRSMWNDRAAGNEQIAYNQSSASASLGQRQHNNSPQSFQSTGREVVPQKRPVASDFFESQMPAKRPFQQNDQIQVISSDSASEGEIDDVAMELDEGSEGEIHEEDSDVNKAAISKGRLQGKMERETYDTDLRQPPADSSGLMRPLQPSSSNADNTPSASGPRTPSKQNKIADLQSWHKEITMMHKRIAAAEERRRYKSQQEGQQSSQSPKLQDTSKGPLPIIRTDSNKASPPVIRTAFTRPPMPQTEASKVFSSPISATSASTPKSPELAASRPSDLPLTPTTPLSALKEPARPDNLRTNLLRRQSTREGTPGALEVARLKALLAAKHAQMAKARAEAEKKEAEMLEEAKQLESQLQAGLLEEQLESETVSAQDAQAGVNESGNDEILPTTEPEEISNSQDVGEAPVAEEIEPAETVPMAAGAMQASGDPFENMRASAESFPDANDNQVSAPEQDDAEIFKSPPILPAAVSGPSTDFAESAELYVHIEAEDDSVYSQQQQQPPLADRSSFLHKEEITNSPFEEALNGSPSPDEGSVSMAESPSEDYEPAEPEDVDMDMSQSSADAEDDETYEPPDPTRTVNFHHDANNEMESDSKQPEEGEASEDELYEPDSGITSQGQDNEVVSPSRAFNSLAPDEPEARIPSDPSASMHSADNEAPYDIESDREDGIGTGEKRYVDGLQIPASPLPESSDVAQVPLSNDSLASQHAPESGSHFTRYSTPIKFFKNFRYHASFDEAVKDGHRSFTYSNKIDPKVSFCLNELINGKCLEPRCYFQHFSQVEMTGAYFSDLSSL